jgi:hypothetical protein
LRVYLGYHPRRALAKEGLKFLKRLEDKDQDFTFKL